MNAWTKSLVCWLLRWSSRHWGILFAQMNRSNIRSILDLRQLSLLGDMLCFRWSFVHQHMQPKTTAPASAWCGKSDWHCMVTTSNSNLSILFPPFVWPLLFFQILELLLTTHEANKVRTLPWSPLFLCKPWLMGLSQSSVSSQQSRLLFSLSKEPFVFCKADSAPSCPSNI